MDPEQGLVELPCLVVLESRENMLVTTSVKESFKWRVDG